MCLGLTRAHNRHVAALGPLRRPSASAKASPCTLSLPFNQTCSRPIVSEAMAVGAAFASMCAAATRSFHATVPAVVFAVEQN